MPDHYSSALAKRSGDQKPGSSRRDDDNDRYGGSRRDAGRSAYDKGEHGDRQQTKGRRFIPCTTRTLPMDIGRFLCDVFGISGKKLSEWCEDEYIRIDTTLDPKTEMFIWNLDPLKEVVASKDWEHFKKELRTRMNEWEAEAYLAERGIPIRRGPPDEDEEEDEYEGGPRNYDDDDDEDDD